MFFFIWVLAHVFSPFVSASSGALIKPYPRPVIEAPKAVVEEDIRSYPLLHRGAAAATTITTE